MKFWSGCDKINYGYLCSEQTACGKTHVESDLTYSLLDNKYEIFIINSVKWLKVKILRNGEEYDYR